MSPVLGIKDITVLFRFPFVVTYVAKRIQSKLLRGRNGTVMLRSIISNLPKFNLGGLQVQTLLQNVVMKGCAQVRNSLLSK